MSASDSFSTGSDRDYREVSEFLFREAQMLDAGQFREWLGRLTDDIHYRLIAPTLSTMRTSTKAGSGPQVVLMDETLGSLRTRVEQLSTPGYTITENPASFTRRFVTNILIDPVDGDQMIRVHSNALVFRSRGRQMEPHLFSMARTDTLIKIDGRIRLQRREAILDESVVSARNIVALL